MNKASLHQELLLPSFIYVLKQSGMEFHTVYDIGACRGDWSRGIQYSVLADSEFILFEANPNYSQILNQTGYKYFNTVLSNPGREYVDFYNGTNTGDSYYKETTANYDNQGSIRMACTTLDHMVESNQLPIPNFIKIDTQGSELDILSGASFLDKVDLIYTECPIICYNAGAPNIHDYLSFFHSKDFIPIDVFEIHRSEETLLQIDIMFMKREAKDKFLAPNVKIRV